MGLLDRECVRTECAASERGFDDLSGFQVHVSDAGRLEIGGWWVIEWRGELDRLWGTGGEGWRMGDLARV